MNTFLFYRLLLAFLIGDYVLQFDWLFKLRYEKRWGVFVHAGFHLLVTLVLCLPYLHDTWFFVAVVLLQVVHGFFDKIKKQTLWAFLGDQLFHFATLAGLAWLFGGLAPVDWLPAWLDALWKDDYLVNLLSGLLLSAYMGMILVNFINKTFRKSFTREVFSDYYRNSYLFGGLLAFSGVELGFQLSPWFFLAAVAPAALLVWLARKPTDSDGSFKGAYKLDYLWMLLWGALWGAIVGLKLYP
jgi:energy-coupling factor transporter transmembrane protein EcfT